MPRMANPSGLRRRAATCHEPRLGRHAPCNLPTRARSRVSERQFTRFYHKIRNSLRNIRYGSLILLIACIAVACRPSTDPIPPSDHPPQLPSLPTFDAGSLEPTVRRQVTEARQRAESNPQDTEANGHLGMVFHAYDFYTQAEPCYRRAAMLAPNETKWQFYLGLIHVANGNPDEAVTAFDRVLVRYPDDLPTLLERASANLTRGETNDALAGFERVIDLNPDAAAAYCGAGQIMLKRGSLIEAIARLDHAIRLAPEYGKAHYVLGQALRKSGRLDKAAGQLRLAEEHKDHLPPLHDPLRAAMESLATGGIDTMHRATDLANEGRYEEAVSLFEESLRIRPDLAETHASLGATLVKLGDPVEAEVHLRQALQLEPNNVKARFNLGVLAHRHGDFAGAVELFEANLRIRADHFDSHYGLGTDLVEIGRPQDAVRHLRRAIALRPDDARTYKKLARVLADDAAFEEAITVLRGAVERLPGDASLADRLAWHLATCPDETIRQADEALAIARQVCEQTSYRVPRALDTLAVCLAALGRHNEAIGVAEQARLAAVAKGDPDLVSQIDAHLSRFRAREPYQE